MEENKKLVPKRRFKKFENAEAWEQRKLSDVVVVGSGKDYKHLGEGDIPVYGTGGYMLSVDEALSYDADAVGIGRKGTIDKPYLLEAPFWTVDTLFYCIPRQSFDLQFTLQLLRKIDWKQKDESTGVPSLSKESINKVETMAPDLNEQKQIGRLFKHIDKLITLHQRKLEKTKALKQAYLSEMFPQEGESVPKRRFAGFTDDWVQRKLGDVSDIVRGASPRPIKDSKWFDDESDIGWLRISDVTEQGGRIHYLEQRISDAGQKKTRVLTESHLLLSIAATVGKPVINYVKTGVHDGFLIFLNPKFDREFMFQWLEMFRPKWQKYGQPGSQVNLNSDLVKNKEIMLPNGDEQTQIGDFFKSIDDLITLHQRKLEKLQNIKKAYLDEMFI